MIYQRFFHFCACDNSSNVPCSFHGRGRGPRGKSESSHPTESGNTNLKDGCHGQGEEEEEGCEEVTTPAAFAASLFTCSSLRDTHAGSRPSGWMKIWPLCFWGDEARLAITQPSRRFEAALSRASAK